MDRDAYNVRLVRWEELIREANSSGIQKKEWCRLHDISENQFYYWQRKVRARAVTGLHINAVGSSDMTQSDRTSCFAELLPPVAGPEPSVPDTTLLHNGTNEQTNPSAGLLLRVGAFEIQVNSPSAEETLRMVMRVLGDA